MESKCKAKLSNKATQSYLGKTKLRYSKATQSFADKTKINVKHKVCGVGTQIAEKRRRGSAQTPFSATPEIVA